MAFYIKRVYDTFQESDGIRLLVDRLWPRGISKERAYLDGWVKELAPSPELRIWFAHKAERFEEFSIRYKNELDKSIEAQATILRIISQSKENTVTLLYGAKDSQINHAVVLKEYLEDRRHN